MPAVLRWAGALCAAAALAVALPSVARAQDASGLWHVELSAPEGSASLTLTLEVNGGDVRGTTGDDEPFTGTFQDGQLALSGPLYVGQAGYSGTLRFSVSVDGDRFTGSGSWDGYDLSVAGRRGG